MKTPNSDFALPARELDMLAETFKRKLKTALIKYERSVPYLYQDSVGQVTIGVGHLVPTEAAVIPLLLRRRSDRQGATKDEKQAAWRAVKKENRNYTGAKDHKHHVYGAGHYEQSSALYMEAADIDQLTEAHIAEFHRYLQLAFTKQHGYQTEFDGMPENVRLALFDMMFNMGPTRFPRPWHELVAAIKQADWKDAAARSNRPQVNAERNAYVRQLFLSQAATPNLVPDVQARYSTIS
jgi:GH24 family phage-related lysozyme (muramidase)